MASGDSGTLLERLTTPTDLRAWVDAHLGCSVPATAVCPGHSSLLDYLWSAYNEPAGDLVLWAPRGGGKTCLGAMATLLDLLHKPGCHVRILGGSLDQSHRMWEHLQEFVDRVADDLLDGRQRDGVLRLKNGSRAAVLPQSQRAVRGLRIQKLRCDEVELFDADIWEAAQLITRSRRDANDRPINGAVEAISTLHRPGGLMQTIVETAPTTRRKVLRWCLLDVLESCPAERQCRSCVLWEDCRGAARRPAGGFIPIDDAIVAKHRVSRETWDCEMMCRRPIRRGCVFRHFDEATHVREDDAPGATLHLAIDFGYRTFVCLWILRRADATSHVIDEYVQSERQMSQHIEEIRGRPGHGEIATIACDPAGNGANDQTGRSDVHLLKQQGWKVLSCSSGILEGVERIRQALAPAAGPPTLFIHPRCAHLRQAMVAYRFPDRPGELPLKDGTHDHLIDALRYYYANIGRGKVHCGRY